ncbi:type II secretion system F family protein [Tepidanaerobacter acetatoxydans]|uniref:type II secretion system F family protein n=1 Tax=Tepidanaerobacter acetatoxydans TaxID=499229 RepID=UPI001BD53268|nr:type II secretion protein F [Tepidanaerobacter acetatoxydans]
MLAAVFYACFKEYQIYQFRKKIYNLSFKDSINTVITKKVRKGTLEKIKEKLRKAGNPSGFTPVTYILAHIGLFIFALFYALAMKMEAIQAVLFVVLAFFIPDTYLMSKRRARERAFRDEMPEIVDMFELGATVDVPLEDIFLLSAESAEKMEVKKELVKLSAEYFITKDKEGCLKKFCENVSLPEVNVLSMALLQGERTGRTLEILSSLSSSLFNTAIAKVAREDKMTEYKALGVLFVLMVSVVMLYMFPYFTNLEGGLRSIF